MSDKRKSTNSELVVFYSWQSDLPDETNRRLIREGLRDASNRLESEYESTGLRVVTDEATRGLSGSPDIPVAIFEKIRNSDVFVADITTTNATRPQGQRACPNPNVMVELGFAVAHLGWSRIVMIFNKAHGSLDDAPFDIRHHRITSYEFHIQPKESGTKSERKSKAAEAKKPLFDTAYEALKAIFDGQPARPGENDDDSTEKIIRRRDVDALQSALRTIHLPTMDEFWSYLERGMIPDRIFHFWEGYRGAVTSSRFHIHDKKLAKLLAKFYKCWGMTVSFGTYFTPAVNTDFYKFMSEPGDYFTDKQQKAWNDLQEARGKACSAWQALLKYVRASYVEIDLEETSKQAWEEYVAFERKMQKRFDARKKTRKSVAKKGSTK